MKRMSNKGEMTLANVPMVVLTLVILALVIGISASVLTSTGANQCAGTFGGVSYTYENNTCFRMLDAANKTPGGPYAYNSTAQGVVGVNIFSQWQPTIAVVLAAAVVIGLVMAYLAFKRSD